MTELKLQLTTKKSFNFIALIYRAIISSNWPRTKFLYTLAMHTCNDNGCLSFTRRNRSDNRCPNGKQKLPNGKFRQDWCIHILGLIRPDHHSKIIANGTHISTRIFRLEILNYVSRRSFYFENVPVVRFKIASIFQKFQVDDKQPLCR